MDTNEEKSTTKTPDTYLMEIDKMLTEKGYKDGHKTGSCIMPAPKRSQSVKQPKE